MISMSARPRGRALTSVVIYSAMNPHRSVLPVLPSARSAPRRGEGSIGAGGGPNAGAQWSSRKVRMHSLTASTLWLLAVTQLTACSSDGGRSPAVGGSGEAGGATTAGSANSAGSAASAGSSGSGGTNGGVGGAASAGKGGAATAGMGGAAVVIPPDDFNPAIQSPSFDCRTSELDTSKRCVSIRGTLNGVAVDTHCSNPALVFLTFDNPQAWVVDCLEGESSAMGRRYQVTVPVQRSGTFKYELSNGAPYAGASMTVAVNLVGGSSVGDHFAGGVLSGVAYEGDFGTEVILGSFHGTWNMPSSGCDAGISMGTCASGEVNGTFRVVHAVKGQ